MQGPRDLAEAGGITIMIDTMLDADLATRLYPSISQI